MTIQRNFKLALTAGHSIPLVINANQYDSGEQWIFTLYNDGVKYNPSSAAIVGIKSDRLGIINTGTVDENGRVVINETRQMTAAVGKNIFELLIDDQTHGTANFMVFVEPRPGDNADLSESDYSLFEEAIRGTSQAAIQAGVQDWMDENLTSPTNPIVDASLSLSGAAADAKKTGDEISALKSAISSLSSIPTAVKNALDTLFQNVAFKNDDEFTDEIAVVHNWATAVNLLSISAVYTQSGTVMEGESLDVLREGLTVTANYDNGSSVVVSDYTLAGELITGTCEITVLYGGKSTVFSVTVSEYAYIPVWNIGASDANATRIAYTGTNQARAVANPMIYELPIGSYEIDIGSLSSGNLYYAFTMISYAEDADVDWTYTQGVNKTLLQNSVTPYTLSWPKFDDATSGWMNVNKQFTITEKTQRVWLNWKKGSAGNTAFTSSDIEQMNANVVLRKVS